MRDDLSSAGFVKKMQDSMEEQQACGDLAARNDIHDAKVTETSGPEKWLALKTRVAQSATEINQGLASDAGLAYSEGGPDSLTLLNRVANKSVQASFDQANGIISYHGADAGSFLPHVEGNELAYCRQNGAPSSGAGTSFVGDVISIEKMSEILISFVISL
jgi:hypothetical protein